MIPQECHPLDSRAIWIGAVSAVNPLGDYRLRDYQLGDYRLRDYRLGEQIWNTDLVIAHLMIIDLVNRLGDYTPDDYRLGEQTW